MVTKPMQDKLIKWGIAGSIPLLFIAAYTAVMVSFVRSSGLSSDITVIPAIQANYSGAINLRVSNIDTLQYTMTLQASLDLGSFPSQVASASRGILISLFTLAVNTRSFSFANGSFPSSVDINLPLSSGSVSRYPLGSYSLAVQVSAFDGELSTTSNFDPIIRVSAQPVFGFTFRYDNIQNSAGEKEFVIIAERT